MTFYNNYDSKSFKTNPDVSKKSNFSLKQFIREFYYSKFLKNMYHAFSYYKVLNIEITYCFSKLKTTFVQFNRQTNKKACWQKYEPLANKEPAFRKKRKTIL